MPECRPPERFKGIRSVRRAGRIAGIIENDRAGPWRYRALKSFLIHGVVFVFIGRHFDANAARHLNLLLINGEIRAENDHLVAGIQNGEHGQRHAQAAGSRDDNLVSRNLLLKILPPRLPNRRDQLRVALRKTVARSAAQGVGVCGVDDALIGRKIRIANAQVDQIVITGQRVRVKRKARLPALKSACDVIHIHSPLTAGMTVAPFGIT